MRITKISVKGLFGYLDHEIPLNQESRITIVHGPNGVGKSVLMRMVHGLFNYDYGFIGETPFDNLNIYFHCGTSIHVQRIDYKERLLVECVNEDGSRNRVPFIPTTYMDTTDNDTLNELVSKEIPTMSPLPSLAEPLWFVEESYDPPESIEVYTIEDILNSHPQIHERLFGQMPDWFARIRKSAGPRFVQTERLKTTAIINGWLPEVGQVFRTSEIARGIGERYRDYLAENETELEKVVEENPDLLQPLLDAIKEMVDNYNVDRSEAMARLRKERPDVFQRFHQNLDEARRSGFFSDERKLFESIINERFLFKSIEIDEDEGIEILDDNYEEVPLSALSSGEQHLLVLYSQLLFEIKPDTLVMIDEPEISMNVVWQRNFLKDLQRIIELRKFDVLVATHSPEVIYDKWDWTVALGAKVDD